MNNQIITEPSDKCIFNTYEDPEQWNNAYDNNFTKKEKTIEEDDMDIERIYFNESHKNNFSRTRDIQNIVNQGKKSEIAPNSRPVRFITTQVESPEEIQRRRLRHDNMQKRIKVNFFHYLKDKMNEQLQRDPESKKLNLEFKNLPQIFVKNTTKEHNRIFLNQTFRDFIIDDSFQEDEEDDEHKSIDRINYENNYKILIYLENKYLDNTELNITLHKKIKEIYKEYLLSEKFGDSIVNLKNEGKDEQYIDIYITAANDFINFYCPS